MQDSGFTETTSLMCFLAISGQHPVLSCPKSPQGSLCGPLQWLDSCDILCLLKWQAAFFIHKLKFKFHWHPAFLFVKSGNHNEEHSPTSLPLLFVGWFLFIYLFIFWVNYMVAFIYLFIFIFFNCTILYWFCHISTWICHRYTHVPHPEPSTLFPPNTIPLGHPSAPAPSIQYRASNLDWWLVSYMILYMFQCHSPKSSHPLPLPQVQKTVLYISVSFAVSYTGLLLPSF